MKILKPIFLTVALISSSANAIERGANLEISRILVHTEDFGKCMVAFSNLEAQAGCKPTFLSLDCAGTYSSKEDSRRFLELAQMAFALEKPITVFYEPTERHNGYCVVKRADLVD